MFDREQRVVVTNELYLEMYGLSPEQAKPGTSFHDLLRIASRKAPTPRAEHLRSTSPSCGLHQGKEDLG